MFVTPLDQIKKELYEEMPSELVNFLPDKWEKIGYVLIIKLNDNLKKYEEWCQGIFVNSGDML